MTKSMTTNKHQRTRALLNAGRQNRSQTLDSHSDDVAASSENSAGGRDALAEFDWHAEYQELADRFTWRIAAYIAWVSSSRRGRKPVTQAELASLLGLRSDRTIRKWRAEQPEIEQEIIRLQASPLLNHRRDIYEALVAGALDVAYGHQDRKLALELLGDYRPKGDVKLQLGLEFTADDLAEADRQLAEWEAKQGNESA